ncbi:hypothetical protein [Sphingobacterium sp. MYb382]|uniref:hypothetical protein n=1 Tax=Sphingobacterium sp. MYb382 TaxID=2745278 RepID=UPI0030AE7379
MKKFILLLMICMSTVASFAKEIKDIDTSVKKVRIGMKMKKVISIMGDSYQIISVREGVVVLGYTATDNTSIYKLRFVDDKLKELDKDWCRSRFGFPYKIQVNNLGGVVGTPDFKKAEQN